MEDVEVTADLPPAMFISGHLGLDFINSIAVPVDEIVEWIGDGRGYLSWLGQAGLLSASEISKIESRMSVKELDAVAAEGRTLREWFRGFVMAHKGHPLKPASLEQLGPLVKILNGDELFWSLERGGAAAAPGKHERAEALPLQLGLERRYRAPKSLLLPVAEQLAKLVCSPDFRWIKGCEGARCTLLVLDLTRRRSRRWCSMAVCGNRAKQAAHRKRIEGRGH
jgi:predicted RNA-binding Zn ribbon-like protein